MSIQRVVVNGVESLEGIVRDGAGTGGVVICHPHPLYGGDLHNSVVGAMETGFSEAGFTTLKFNFRGVGNSTGRYDGCDGETEDVVAACRFLREKAADSGRFVLAGYSFGAWASVRALAKVPFLTDLFLVALPFSMGGSDGARDFPGKIYFVGGSRDDISPLDDLLSFYKGLKGEKFLKVVPASHFFEGREDEISEFIVEAFRDE